jgi:hypothetical protein
VAAPARKGFGSFAETVCSAAGPGHATRNKAAQIIRGRFMEGMMSRLDPVCEPEKHPPLYSVAGFRFASDAPK